MLRIIRIFPAALVILFWMLAVAGRFWSNGIAYGLDYGIFQPDGAHYTYRTLVFLGSSPIESSIKVAEWYQANGFKNNFFDPSLLRPESTGTWGLVAPRVLYSFLSMPFVLILGINGMLVIPILSFLTLLLVAQYFSQKIIGAFLGIIVVLSLSTSPTILRWMVANLTDGLLAALFGLVAILLYKHGECQLWKTKILTLILLTSATRFSLPIWIGIALILLINSKSRASLFVFISSTLASVPTFLYMPDDALLPGNQTSSLFDKLMPLFISYFKIAFWELSQLAVLDRALLMLLLVTTFLSIAFLKQISSQYFLSVLLSVWTIGAINGTVGVNFRYQLPLIGFMCWALATGLREFRNSNFWRHLHIISGKT
jgi:hypothetical protein